MEPAKTTLEEDGSPARFFPKMTRFRWRSRHRTRFGNKGTYICNGGALRAQSLHTLSKEVEEAFK